MRIVLSIILSLCFASAALANSNGGEGGSGGGHGASNAGAGNRFMTLFRLSSDEADEADDAEEAMIDDPRVFTLPAVVAPLSVDGRLTGYAYVRVHVRAADGQNVWTMQEHTHFALDAMVRAASRISLANADGSGIDRELASRVWGAVLRDYYGAAAIAEVQVSGGDTRMIRR